jgi:hypothetical protein
MRREDAENAEETKHNILRTLCVCSQRSPRYLTLEMPWTEGGRSLRRRPFALG